ncbi:MAG: PrsW family intramembrane metalloprotease, partial [Saccharofermentans sp.]|nr:PrsW family intramembrane metalloprotease [Saccharofermentans sp.]
MVFAIIIFLLATVPAVVLFFMTRALDKKEKESPVLLLTIALMMLPFLIATIIVEGVFQGLLSWGTGAGLEHPVYIILYCFLIIGPAEELFKFLGARITTWNSPEFNCKFDGIVYCTTSALTFAFIENAAYILTADTPLVTSIMRAICCFPGHFMYGVVMGVFYSNAKIAANFGDKKKKRKNIFLAILIPALIHGLYDTLAFSLPMLATELEYASGSEETALTLAIVAVFGALVLVVVGTYITLFVTIIKQSK